MRKIYVAFLISQSPILLAQPNNDRAEDVVVALFGCYLLLFVAAIITFRILGILAALNLQTHYGTHLPEIPRWLWGLIGLFFAEVMIVVAMVMWLVRRVRRVRRG